MPYHVVVLQRAEEEVDAIVHWLSQRSVQGAATWINAFDRMREALAGNPFLFGVAPERDLIGQEIRQALFKTPRGRMYRALFTIVGSEVRVLHVRGPRQKHMRRKDV